MKKFLIIAGSMLVLGLLVAPSAFAQDCADYSFCSQGGSAAIVTDRTARFTYDGGDGLPGGSFSVDIFSTPEHIGDFNFDSNGNFDILIQIPNDVGAGTHTLRAVGQSRFGSQLTVTATIFVPGKALTPTGAKVLPIAILGVGMVLVGGTAVGVTKRRKTKRS
ncbi:MAG: hypothetical protein ACYDCC_07520 [Actinomycetota bacterium]